jgi:hypothetical protein
MKKCAVWVLLLGTAFSLFAQTGGSVAVYLPPVTGTSSAPEDNAVLTDILALELRFRNITVKETPEEANYSLIGALAPVDADSGDGEEEGLYILSLSLQDKDGLPLYEQGLYYATLEEANSYLPSILLNMLSNIFILQVTGLIDSGKPDDEAIEEPEEEPVDREDPDAWRSKQWYAGAGVFWTPRLYYGTMTETNLLNFGFGFSAEFHFLQFAAGKLEFLKYLSAGTGMEFAPDWVVASPRINDDYRNIVLQIPLTLNLVLKPGVNYLHEPYLGLLFNIPLLPDTIPPLLSWKAGFQFGVKAGQGIAYGDIRFSMDFGKSGVNANRPSDTRKYDRYMLYVGIGYKHDLIAIIETVKKKFQKIPAPDAVEEFTEETFDEFDGETVEEVTSDEAPEESDGETIDE